MEEDKKYSVYIHTNKDNGKNYIGMTSTKPERRWGRQGEGYLRISYAYSLENLKKAIKRLEHFINKLRKEKQN